MLGIVLPGPGGFPVFIIGFALVTFPGKRSRPALPPRAAVEDRRPRLRDRGDLPVDRDPGHRPVGDRVPPGSTEHELRARSTSYAEEQRRVLYVILACLIIFLVTRVSLKMANGLLHLLPRIRRKFRPWMKRQGLKLLPPRRRKAADPLPEDEILEIAPRHQHRIRAMWLSSARGCGAPRLR